LTGCGRFTHYGRAIFLHNFLFYFHDTVVVFLCGKIFWQGEFLGAYYLQNTEIIARQNIKFFFAVGAADKAHGTFSPGFSNFKC